MTYQTTVNEQFTHKIDVAKEMADWDLISITENKWHLLKNNKSYTLELVSQNLETKTMTILVNGNSYQVAIKDKLDLLLEKMGMGNLQQQKINEIKAPMPGLVLAINVKVGDAIQKKDALVVLEAMKMENVLKSPGEGIIESIEIKQGQAVEKGQILIKLA